MQRHTYRDLRQRGDHGTWGEDEELRPEEFVLNTDQELIDKARAQYQEEGSIEIDHLSKTADLELEVSRSDEGAYVRAWVWVDYDYV